MEMKIYERWLQALLSSAPRSRVLARLASLAQIGELARRLATPDLSHIESFVNDGKPSTANFEISPPDVNSMDKLIKLLPTNVCTGLDEISALLLRLISPAILESNAKKALYVRYS